MLKDYLQVNSILVGNAPDNTANHLSATKIKGKSAITNRVKSLNRQIQ